MSLALATRGVICTEGGIISAVGGGAPAMPQDDMPRPTLMVTSVNYTRKKKDDKNPIKIIIKDVN